jgi:ketosteroid isomerase-like protein
MAAEGEANLALVRAGIEASNRGDTDALLGVLDPEVEFHIAPGLGNAGTYHRHDGFLEGLGGWLDAWDNFTIDSAELEAVGERHVVGDIRQSARGRGSGVEVEMRLGYMWEVRRGRAVRFHILPDRDAALAAASEGERRSE